MHYGKLKSIFLKCLIWRFFPKCSGKQVGFSQSQFPGNVAFLMPVSCTVWEILISVTSDIALRPMLKKSTMSFLDSKPVYLHRLDKLNKRDFLLLLPDETGHARSWAAFAMRILKEGVYTLLPNTLIPTGISSLTSKGRSIRSRHPLS